jgi:hypothetical protein
VTVPTAAVAGFVLTYGSYSKNDSVVEGDDEVAEESGGASDVDVEPITADEPSLGSADVEQLDMVPRIPSDRATTSPVRGSNRLLMTFDRPRDQVRSRNP